MRSLLFLLFALIPLSYCTIYWKTGGGVGDKVQTQANLIYIDRYLAAHPNKFEVVVGEADVDANGDVRAIAFIKEEGSQGKPKLYRAKLTLSKNNGSPTGYVMSKGFICKDECTLYDQPRRFY
uniref:Lipoprotein n=1 Tax=Caenorhabditis tropicalis TaxID=1561998 RepID=A0A1I7U3V7_9PELO